MRLQKITPFLWFEDQAEEAMNYYVSIFKNAKAGKIVRNGNAGPGPKGSVLTASFELEGLEFTALNGGRMSFKFNESVSFVVHCQSQQEVDTFWEKLSEGGEPGQCGWLKDRFGLSWQIVPDRLLELISDPDAAKAERVVTAMLKMAKIDVARLEEAAAG
jgi:predicted 3-demethylubiquinone-9 3-methyltransferase (glyoxalase superfamily)